MRVKRFFPIKCLLFAIVVSALPSCKTAAPRLDYQEIVRAAIRLDVDIDLDDFHPLYIESARWIGVPYRYGGSSLRGVDCSGLVCAIYKEVYRKKLARTSEEQRARDCRSVPGKNLKAGDLVFFHDGRRKKEASHVGVYLKEGKFIHASSGKGVIVSDLSEPYYKEHWMQGGRVDGRK